jgi:NAD-dependent dihydropyrimidine dehydrogenase PreA subunit
VARSAVRTAAPDQPINPGINIVTALDVARSAVRFGAKEVRIVCLESLAEMPADQNEILEAQNEGIVIHAGKGPSRILGEGGRVTGLETIDCASVFDANHRFNPRFVPGTEVALAADTVILAIGQACDLSFLRPDDGVEATPRGTIRVDPTTLATTSPGIYAGGDAAFGPRIAINAIADGRRAATSIHGYLRQTPVTTDLVEVVIQPLPGYRRVLDFEGVPRQTLPSLPIKRRIGIAEIEQCLSEETARLEASRCLQCWINTVFREDRELGTECILCGGCADVCPEKCIEFVPLSSLSADAELWSDLVAECAEDGRAAAGGPFVSGTALIKDETICIRCGLCALRCPAGTITMEQFSFAEPSHG